MEAELDRQIRTNGLEIDQPLPQNWRLRRAMHEYYVWDVAENEWILASTYKFRILRWDSKLYGPEPVSPPPPKPVVAAPGNVQPKAKAAEKPKAERKLVTRYTPYERQEWKQIIPHLRALYDAGEISDLNGAFHATRAWLDARGLTMSDSTIYAGLERHRADWCD
jgi:hypothetical protein